MKIVDVSDKFEIGSVDDECLPVTQCACGEEFSGWSDYVLSIYEDTTHECSKCHRKFFFRNSIRIYEVVDEIKDEATVIKDFPMRISYPYNPDEAYSDNPNDDEGDK